MERLSVLTHGMRTFVATLVDLLLKGGCLNATRIRLRRDLLSLLNSLALAQWQISKHRAMTAIDGAAVSQSLVCFNVDVRIRGRLKQPLFQLSTELLQLAGLLRGSLAGSCRPAIVNSAGWLLRPTRRSNKQPRHRRDCYHEDWPPRGHAESCG